jgi:hypothetical protein
MRARSASRFVLRSPCVPVCEQCVNRNDPLRRQMCFGTWPDTKFRPTRKLPAKKVAIHVCRHLAHNLRDSNKLADFEADASLVRPGPTKRRSARLAQSVFVEIGNTNLPIRGLGGGSQVKSSPGRAGRPILPGRLHKQDMCWVRGGGWFSDI